MQTNYLMEYLNDYTLSNENAKIIKIKFVFKCMFKAFIFMKQMWIRRFSDMHSIMHMC